ncbi:MAG: hypothetical protein E7472_07325 [Ruminococcaceae bacterium]|nr:hypothetical protein [Oscillospiraceae bacterium]
MEDQEKVRQQTESASAAGGTSQEEEETVISVWHGSGNTSFFRRRYFDGFTQYETLNANGKIQRHNVYTGTWYTQDLTREARIRYRCIYILLWLAATALLTLCCTRSVDANMAWYSGVAAFVGLFGFGWVAVGLFNEFTVPVQRTIGQYRASSKSMQRGAIMAAAASGICGLISLFYAFFGTERIGVHLLLALGEAAAAVLILLLRRMERGINYIQTRSKDAGKYTM